ncbi:hypothetical protein B5K06_13830 [Rhizobium grahamii]|uniref:Uncharacterized protein n=1 Tax=Rhizobium grahamii TaxID=1120045 RepID=A0A370KPU1_9HYPH|nr:hypothetical protein B5K06_13830 [Rhizobium grahamii]
MIAMKLATVGKVFPFAGASPRYGIGRLTRFCSRRPLRLSEGAPSSMWAEDGAAIKGGQVDCWRSRKGGPLIQSKALASLLAKPYLIP